MLSIKCKYRFPDGKKMGHYCNQPTAIGYFCRQCAERPEIFKYLQQLKKPEKVQVIKMSGNRYKTVKESFVVEVVDKEIVFIGVAANDKIISATEEQKKQAQDMGLIVK